MSSNERVRVAIAETASMTPLPLFTGPGQSATVTVAGCTITFSSNALPPPVIGGLKEFTVFENLPRELKTKIWGFALEGRIITAVEIPRPLTPTATDGIVAGATSADDEKNKEKDDIENAFHIIGAPIPNIFSVCKEVMALSAAMGYKRLFQVRGSSKMVFFNESVDTLRLHTITPRVGLKQQVRLFDALVNPTDLKFVQHVQVSVIAFIHENDDVIKDIATMTSAHDLAFLGGFIVPARYPGLVVKLTYSFDGKDAIPSAVTQLPPPLIGIEPMRRSLAVWVPFPPANSIFTDFQTRVTQAMLNAKNFPSRGYFPSVVKLECTFTDPQHHST